MAKHYLLVAAVIVALFWAGVYVWHDSASSNTAASGTLSAVAQNAIINSTAKGFHITPQMIASNSSSQCALQLTTFCDNNEPSQFVCVNTAYSSNVSAQYQKIYSGKGQACPQFLLAGRLSCAVSGGYCTVADNLTT